MSRHDQLRADYERFCSDHPRVWSLFCRFTYDRIHRGFKHYSAKGIFERIRWETAEAETGEQEFKLNNNYASFYARDFMRIAPEHEGFFRTRRQISQDAPGTDLPELGPDDFE